MNYPFKRKRKREWERETKILLHLREKLMVSIITMIMPLKAKSQNRTFVSYNTKPTWLFSLRWMCFLSCISIRVCAMAHQNVSSSMHLGATHAFTCLRGFATITVSSLSSFITILSVTAQWHRHIPLCICPLSCLGTLLHNLSLKCCGPIQDS